MMQLTDEEIRALERSPQLREESAKVLEDAEAAVARLGKAVERTAQLAERFGRIRCG